MHEPTDLKGIFDSSDPVQLLSTLEFIWTPISQAGIQPAAMIKQVSLSTQDWPFIHLLLVNNRQSKEEEEHQ